MVHIERKYDAHWVKKCTMIETERNRDKTPEEVLVGLYQGGCEEYWPVLKGYKLTFYLLTKRTNRECEQRGNLLHRFT